MAENFSIEHSRTKITEVKKTIEDKKQKLDELKQQKKSLMDAGLALDSSNLDSAVQATLMLKSCSPINIMRVFISSKMLRLQFIGMKKQQTKAASTLCIGPDTFITPNQSTTTKLVSGSHSPQKRETKMPKKSCAII